MNIILFHELNESIVKSVIDIFNDETHIHNKLIKNSEFTFDDGLFSQYKFVNKLKSVTCKKCTVFVSSDFVYTGEDVQLIDIVAPKAHELARMGDYRAYCTVEQLKEMEFNGINIGNHGATHYNFEDAGYGIRKTLNKVRSEVDSSVNFFKSNNIVTKSFAYPYNNKIPFYETLLKNEGVVDFYGRERINIDTLL